MRTVLALLVVGLSCAVARAEVPPPAFVPAAASPTNFYLADLGTIQSEGDVKVATVLLVGRTGEILEGVDGTVDYKTFSTAFNCRDKTLRTLSVKYFSEKGTLIGSEKMSGDPVVAVPGTTDEDVLDIVCRGEAPERPSMAKIEDAADFGRSFLQTIDRMPADKR